MSEDLALMRARPEEIRWMNFVNAGTSHAIYRLTRGARTACGKLVKPRRADFAFDAYRCRSCERIVKKLWSLKTKKPGVATNEQGDRCRPRR